MKIESHSFSFPFPLLYFFFPSKTTDSSVLKTHGSMAYLLNPTPLTGITSVEVFFLFPPFFLSFAPFSPYSHHNHNNRNYAQMGLFLQQKQLLGKFFPGDYQFVLSSYFYNYIYIFIFFLILNHNLRKTKQEPQFFP